MTDRQPTKAYNDHNVYILGAGFSVEAGLPVIKNFMNRMRDAAVWLEEQGDHALEAEAIASVLQFRLSAAAAAYRVPLDIENIEELFSLASASSVELAEDVTIAIAATLDYCRATAPEDGRRVCCVSKFDESGWQSPSNWKPTGATNPWADTPNHVSKWYDCPAYEFYVGLMCGYFSEQGSDRKNTVISLNYDTVVEDAMWGLNFPFRYADNENVLWQKCSAPDATKALLQPVTILKLHGSVNVSAGARHWLGDEPVDEMKGKDLKELDNSVSACAYRTYRDLLRGNCRPTLVAPTWQKSMDGYLLKVWSESVAALETATRIIIIGYSIPQTDQHFRYLLAAGLQNNISLRKVLFVNPACGDTPEGREIERRLLGLFREEHHKQGIVEVIPTSMGEFLARPDGKIDEESDRQRIGRTLNPRKFRGTNFRNWTAQSGKGSVLSNMDF